jgi:hypothetical protein
MSVSAKGLRGVSAAYVRFREAVLDLSDDPTKANIVRYLNASRALDVELTEPPPKRPSRHAQGSST